MIIYENRRKVSAAVLVITFVLSTAKLLHEKIGVLLKAQYRTEKEGMLYGILCRTMPGYMKNRMLEWSFVRRHKKEWRLRYVLASFLIACTAVLASVCVTLYPAFLHDAQTYSPYDMDFSVTEVNQSFACDYQIEEGQFLNLFQYDPEDGYE